MPPAIPMLIITADTVAGREIVSTLGGVTGSVVWSKHIGRDIMAGLKTLVGGEIRGYTEMLVEARGVATERMATQARNMGADAIVGCRYTTSTVMQGMCEIVAYGTAVKLG